MFVTLPFSLCLVIKVVQEYEKTVIFRLGRILTGGARGPGVFFIIPCVDIYEVIDMRVQNFSVPPQEAKLSHIGYSVECQLHILDPNQGQCDSIRERDHVLQSAGCDQSCD